MYDALKCRVHATCSPKAAGSVHCGTGRRRAAQGQVQNRLECSRIEQLCGRTKARGHLSPTRTRVRPSNKHVLRRGLANSSRTHRAEACEVELAPCRAATSLHCRYMPRGKVLRIPTLLRRSTSQLPGSNGKSIWTLYYFGVQVASHKQYVASMLRYSCAARGIFCWAARVWCARSVGGCNGLVWRIGAT